MEWKDCMRPWIGCIHYVWCMSLSSIYCNTTYTGAIFPVMRITLFTNTHNEKQSIYLEIWLTAYSGVYVLSCSSLKKTFFSTYLHKTGHDQRISVKMWSGIPGDNWEFSTVSHKAIIYDFIHFKKGFVILTIISIFFTRVATVDMVLWEDTRIVPRDSQLWAIQCTWSSYRNNRICYMQGLGRCLGHQISAIRSKRVLFPHKDPCELQYKPSVL